MAEKADLAERGSKSSGDEKAIVGGQLYDPALVHDLPPDPDAHLSAEEKAAIVRLPLLTFASMVLTFTGSETSLEAGFHSHPMGKRNLPLLMSLLTRVPALYPLSACLPRPNEHR